MDIIISWDDYILKTLWAELVMAARSQRHTLLMFVWSTSAENKISVIH